MSDKNYKIKFKVIENIPDLFSGGATQSVVASFDAYEEAESFIDKKFGEEVAFRKARRQSGSSMDRIANIHLPELTIQKVYVCLDR